MNIELADFPLMVYDGASPAATAEIAGFAAWMVAWRFVMMSGALTFLSLYFGANARGWI
ncbi:MAG TPA: hypothetical protein VFS78_03690 [Vicinamibacteria bacterium]|nr:hypothetical protein [Vicinamibacteria bacterium]